MIVRLSEFSLSDVINLLPDRYKLIEKDIIKQAYNKHLQNDLRYNTITGHTRDQDLGIIAKYCNSEDIPEYTNLNCHTVLEDQLMGWINNSISRVLRGFEP